MLRISAFISLACLAALAPAMTLNNPSNDIDYADAELVQIAHDDDDGDDSMSQVDGDSEFLSGLGDSLKKMGSDKLADLKK